MLQPFRIPSIFNTSTTNNSFRNRSVLEVELTEPADGLHRGGEGRAGAKNDYKHFGLSS